MAHAYTFATNESLCRLESINYDNVPFNELNDFRNKCSSYIDRNQHIQQLAKNNHLLESSKSSSVHPKKQAKSSENHVHIKVIFFIYFSILLNNKAELAKLIILTYFECLLCCRNYAN
jgi:hypothetical protein